MHYTGPIYRHPFEMNSVFLELTSGCSHNRCTFCTFYHDAEHIIQPFKMASADHIREDIEEIRSKNPNAKRIFATGGDPFVLSSDKLISILTMIHDSLPKATTGMYARISNLKNKTVPELKRMKELGLKGLYIGVESGDDEVLKAVNKGYTVADIVKGCQKLDEAGVDYQIIYLGGLAGAGKCEESARKSAKVFNQIHPFLINLTTVTVLPESQMYLDMKAGNYELPTETERIREMRTLISLLKNPIFVNGISAQNVVNITGQLPDDREKMLSQLDLALKKIDSQAEQEFGRWRKNITRI